MDYPIDRKAKRRVNSRGDTGFSQGLLDAISRGGDARILFISSAGNDGANNDTTAHWPSNYGALPRLGPRAQVASITSTGAKASSSNYGARTVDLGAPDDKIFSTVPVSKYASRSGTSMAAPHVTGAAALYAASQPSAGHSDECRPRRRGGRRAGRRTGGLGGPGVPHARNSSPCRRTC